MNTENKLLKLRKLADAMYYAANYLTTDASRMHKAMDEYHQFIINEYYKEEQTIPDIVDEHFDEMLGEEPVNNDFEMALAEMIDKAQTSVVEPLVIAAQWKDELIKLAKGKEPVSEDLELTWEDIKTIDKLLNQCVDYSNPYQEVLKRFKDLKK